MEREEAITFERHQNEEEAITFERQQHEEETITSERHPEEEACSMLKNGRCTDDFSMMREKYPSEHFCREICGFYIKCK